MLEIILQLVGTLVAYAAVYRFIQERAGQMLDQADQEIQEAVDQDPAARAQAFKEIAIAERRAALKMAEECDYWQARALKCEGRKV